MNASSARFAERRRAGWLELERLVGRARGGALRHVPTADLERLGVLYRRVSSDLVIARRDLAGDPIVDYLNTLVARTHPLLHRAAPPRPGALLDFFATGIPRAFRQAAPYVVASLGLTVIGVIAGWLAVALRPDIAASITPQTSLFEKMARGQVPAGTDTGLATGLAITLNNVRVALIAAACGVLLGLPTAFVLLSNGWVLGTLGASIHRDGLDVTFWSYIAPHGVIELSIIVLAGATGLMLADAELRPGLLRRSDALAARAGEAIALAAGVACLLVVCGMIEGYLSPSAAPEAVKYAVGAVGGLTLYAWLLVAGRGRQAPRRAVSLDVAAALAGGGRGEHAA